jgi:MYXO-CTERM domain-containing protein
MSLVIVLLVLAGASAGLSAWALIRLLQLSRGRSPLQSTPDLHSTDLVSVVIAARDEAETLVACLSSVLEQVCVSQILFVDDHSSDGTLGLAQEMAKKDSRLLVLSAPPLPEGWVGKSHALHYALRLSDKYVWLYREGSLTLWPDGTPPGSSGCNCQLGEHDRTGDLAAAWLLVAGLALLVARRRSSRSLARDNRGATVHGCECLQSSVALCDHFGQLRCAAFT